MEKTTTLKVQVQVGVNDLHSFCKFSWEVEKWWVFCILKYNNNIITSEKTLLDELYSLWEKIFIK